MLNILTTALLLATTYAFTIPRSSLPFLSPSTTTQLSAIQPGSTVALTTPMKDDGSIDTDAYRKLVKWHVEEGTKGLCVLGTTGEASTLTFSERSTILKITEEELKDSDIMFMVGTGTIKTDTCIEYSKQALEFGADCSLIVTPYYVKPTLSGLITHYKKINQAVPTLPIILYNVPSRTGVDMSPEDVGRVREKVGNVVGIKEATGEVGRVEVIKGICGEDFFMWSGDDDTGSEFVLKGGDGVISVTANLAPKRMQNIMQAALNNDKELVDKINQPLIQIHDKLFCQANPIPVKYALWKMEKIEKGIRCPLTGLDEEYWGVVDGALESAGLI
ncbi:hypothetical protein TrLO_g10682 [Triparma laevis f. longispina]|uniref:4-hydroxy-tetrahydrodipicolinate synthase n=1 Tax=Triparma laevis f. longispina TaxID=1714387 RepID=A0A9W7FF00_9STRA|nr:hypothetical protein TrLO_g10682 [Triparma laevis f. longispina]